MGTGAISVADAPPPLPVDEAKAGGNAGGQNADAQLKGELHLTVNGRTVKVIPTDFVAKQNHPTLEKVGGQLNVLRDSPETVVGSVLLEDKHMLAGYSWMVQLLPHIGHKNVYDKFSFDKSWSSEANLSSIFTLIPEFLDPENPSARYRSYAFTQTGPGLTHFVGMAGVEDSRNVTAASLPRDDNRVGIFGYQEVAKNKSITDGLSTTIMMIGSGRITGMWVQGGGATIRGARSPYFDKITGFGSGAVQGKGTAASFADGSVRYLAAEIDPEIFKALCTIHGGEKLDESKLPAISTQNVGVHPKALSSRFNDKEE